MLPFPMFQLYIAPSTQCFFSEKHRRKVALLWYMAECERRKLAMFFTVWKKVFKLTKSAKMFCEKLLLMSYFSSLRHQVAQKRKRFDDLMKKKQNREWRMVRTLRSLQVKCRLGFGLLAAKVLLRHQYVITFNTLQITSYFEVWKRAHLLNLFFKQCLVRKKKRIFWIWSMRKRSRM